jgi:hypothetical protein
MLKSILQKCLTELACDKPDLSYIRGMVEVLLESQQEKAPFISQVSSSVAKEVNLPGVLTVTNTGDEPAAALDRIAAARLAEVKQMSGE